MNLAITDPQELLFGYAPKPLKCGRNIELGNGIVYPEINFTLPQSRIEPQYISKIIAQYEEIITDICQRAVDLEAEGIVVEYELLPPMTLEPQWGADITATIRKQLDRYHQEYGLSSVLRVTPVDIRDIARPPLMRSGEYTEKMFSSFEMCAQAGGELLSIESTGGKEIHDDALLSGDLSGIIYALGILGVRDMKFLWDRIADIAKKTATISAGDTACGFANTAMILADKGMIPKVLAAVVRSATIPRSLIAYQTGAVGPSKDCAYEGPFLKALTGVPISMEGKSSACAHLSKLGNIAAAYADAWSNESVQNVRLLSAFAPTVSMEQLIYDCRLQNVTLREGRESALQLRDWLVKSDANLDPQAYIFKPDHVIRIARAIAAHEDPYQQTIAAVRETIEIIQSAVNNDELNVSNTEKRWLSMLSMQIEAIPETEQELAEIVNTGEYINKYIPSEYGIDQ